MYYIKIKEVATGEETKIEFESKEAAKLYRDYHCYFNAWDKRESWVAERFLSPEHKKLVVDEKETTLINSKKEEVKVKHYKIKPLFHFVEDNLGLTRTLLMWDSLRQDRKAILDATDWTQIADSKLDSKDRQLYREYRQYLRDTPLYYNDETIEKYKIMTFDEWREFFKR